MSISEIIKNTNHRPWPLPTRSFSWYQEWNRVLFIHWRVPKDIILRLVPTKLDVDTFEDQAYVSLVPFTMEKIRPRLLPSFPPISNFHEVNLRTYVSHNNKPGVFFLDIEAQKQLSVWLCNRFSSLPYEHAKIVREEKGSHGVYELRNQGKNLSLRVDYEILKPKSQKSPIDVWLTERYRLYLIKNNDVFFHEVHHDEWPIFHVNINSLTHNYKISDFDLSARKPDLCHYSPSVKVLAYSEEIIES